MFAKLMIIPLVAILLAACGGTSSSTDPKAAAQAHAQQKWDSLNVGDKSVTCSMYKISPTTLQKSLEKNEVYKDKSPEERQMFVDAVFAILDKEC